MLKKISILRLLTIYTIISSAFVIIIGAGSFFFLKQNNKDFDNVANIQLPSVRTMTLADMYHDGMRAIVMETLYQASQNVPKEDLAAFIKEIEEMSERFNQAITELSNVGLHGETQTAILEAIPEIKAYSKISNDLVNEVHSKGLAAGQAKLADFSKQFETLEGKLEKMGELIEADAAKLKSSGDTYVQMDIIWTCLFVFFSILLGIVTLRILKQSLLEFSHQIEEVGKVVGESTTELARSSEEMAGSASKAAAAIEETVASLEEINATVKYNTENASQAQKVSLVSKQSAEIGNSDMQKLIQSIGQIADASKKMNDIISAIDDIAFQTNLLALNAAVEAARAGEQGKGFAVVAEAVRSLAQRSAVAAKDISNIIQDNETKIKHGSEIAAKSGVVLSEIVQSVVKVSTLNDEIATSSHEQAEGINQISKAMNSMDENSQKNAAISEQVSASCTDLKDQADRLSRALDDFKQRIFGSAA